MQPGPCRYQGRKGLELKWRPALSTVFLQLLTSGRSNRPLVVRISGRPRPYVVGMRLFWGLRAVIHLFRNYPTPASASVWVTDWLTCLDLLCLEMKTAIWLRLTGKYHWKVQEKWKHNLLRHAFPWNHFPNLSCSCQWGVSGEVGTMCISLLFLFLFCLIFLYG